MAEGRQPILRGTGQSDADMKGFNILNVGALGDIQQATLIVEPGLAVAGEVGERGSGLPFSSIEAAVGEALPGDVIYLRPGIHAFDGTIDLFHLTGLTISGYGAKIMSLSEVNENIKFTVRSADVTFEGIEFDGAVTDTPNAVGEGCITVTETGFTIRDCWVHDQNGFGVHCPDHYDNVRILDCVFSSCAAGIFCEADLDTTRDTEGVWIKRNLLLHNRSFGVGLTGPGPDSGHFITEISITENRFAVNDTAQDAVPALILTFSCQGVQVHDNFFEDESSGICLDKVRDGSVTGNNLKGINANAIWLIGCIAVKVNDNMIDSRNSAGSPATNAPILIAGSYAAPNDAGQFIITGNELIFGKTNAVSISISNATAIVINSNRIEGTILLAACTSVMVNGNLFSVAQTTQAILIDASDRAISKITIESNRFNFTGASINRVIATTDAAAFGIDDVLISGNATPTGVTYGQGTYVHAGSNAATRVVQIGNVPESATVTTGWVNAGAPVTQVLVSQARGVDATGARQSRTARFKTINAAITAATSGDTVVVEDGTFNERIDAKNGITVRFLPSAKLVSTSSGGCIRTTAVDQQFYLYHEHTPLVCSQNTTDAISSTHSGAYLALHCSITNTGAGTLPTGIRVSDGTVEVWGYTRSSNSNAIMTAAGGSPVVIIHGGLTSNYDVQGNAIALQHFNGLVKLLNCRVLGASTAIDLNANTATLMCNQCSIGASNSNAPAITITSTGASVPTLHDCVLQSGSSATQSISVGSAQTVRIMGSVMANKGADPPTNVTFTGGGEYTVNSGVILD